MAGYETYTFKDWGALKEHLNYFRSDWIFRGQANADWGLETSIERTDFKWTNQKAELVLISEFQRGVHNFVDDKRLPQNLLGWLALMQHHGTPTRMLDFTTSPYVAAYFALSEMEKSSAIWAINNSWLSKETKKRITEKDYYTSYGQVDFNNDYIFEKTILKNEFNFVTKVSPHERNQRIYYQQGLHVVPGNTSISFMENLKSMSNLEENVEKIKLAPELRFEALQDLLNMNINRATLFPGIDGFAISVKEKVQILREMFTN
jgi:hypothetical protein